MAYSRKPLLFLLCGLLFFGTAVRASEQVYKFDELDTLDTWQAWTNDGNLQNGWQIENGVLRQTAVNDDSSQFGDRLLIRQTDGPLISPENELHISLDILLCDYEGGELRQGIVLFPDIETPENRGAIYIIQEYHEKENYAGIRVVCDDWMSPLHPYEPEIGKWHRLIIHLSEVDENSVEISAGFDQVSTQTTDWIANVVVDKPIARQRNTFGLLKGRNP